MKTVILGIVIALFLCGCETVHRGAQEVGKPVGAATDTLGGITEGAVQGYQDKDVDNPYNR